LPLPWAPDGSRAGCSVTECRYTRGRGGAFGHGPVRAAVTALRRVGFATEAQVSSVGHHSGRPPLAHPRRITPGLELAVIHRARLRRGTVRVLATAEFDGDDWVFVVRRDSRSGCPDSRNTGDAWGWVAQATEHVLGPAVGPPRYPPRPRIQAGHRPEADLQQRRALATFAENDLLATWRHRFVGTTLVYDGSYDTKADGSTQLRGRRTLAIVGPAEALAEQRDADGRPVWRHAGPPLEVIERLRGIPRPGEPGAPVRTLSESRAFLPGFRDDGSTSRRDTRPGEGPAG
jgi:hypothetical protein